MKKALHILTMFLFVLGSGITINAAEMPITETAQTFYTQISDTELPADPPPDPDPSGGGR